MHSFATSLYIGVILAVVLLAASTGYLFWRLHRKNRRYFDQYAARTIDLLEKERQRIGGDLHDELVPVIAISRMMIMEKLKEDDDHRAWAAKVSEDLMKVLERMRGIVLCLRPASLQRGLGLALLDHINTCKQLYRIDISFHYDFNEEADAEFNLQMYRMVQELIQNALKHAEATRLMLSIRKRGQLLIAEFSDNGKGFDPEVVQPLGIGLSTIKERAVLLNGCMQRESVPGKGTHYYFEIPLHEENQSSRS